MALNATEFLTELYAVILVVSSPAGVEFTSWFLPQIKHDSELEQITETEPNDRRDRVHYLLFNLL